MGARTFTNRFGKLALLVALAAPATLMLASEGVAEGQKTQPRPDGGEAKYDPENVTALSQHMETLLKGIEKYQHKDFTGAVDTFKRAIQMNPKHPLGPYLLGEAYLGMANLGEAEAAFRQAEDVADSRNPTLRGQVLFAVADCYERQKKLDQAKLAWERYAEHAAKFADSGAHPASAAARLKAIDDVVKQEKAYEIVRQRIAAEKADAGADAGKAAPPPAKK